MSLPFNVVSYSALTGTVGGQGVFIKPGTELVYVFDNVTGAGTHMRIVDFSTISPTVGSIVTLAHAVGTAPGNVGAGHGWCVDQNGLVWTTYTSGGHNLIGGMDPVTGSVTVSYDMGTSLTKAYSISPVTANSGTKYVAAVVNDGNVPATWHIIIVNAATGSLLWDYTLAAPGAIPGGGTYPNFTGLSLADDYVPSDDTRYAYFTVYHASVPNTTVDDFVIYRLDLQTSTATLYKYHQGNSSIGGGLATLVDPVNAHLIVYCSGGAVEVIDATTGNVLSTTNNLLDTWADSGAFIAGMPFAAAQFGLVDNTNDEFIGATPSSAGASVRRVKLSTLTAIDDNTIPDAWTGAGLTSRSFVYAGFVPALMYTPRFYPSSPSIALLELLFTPSLGVSPTSLSFINRVFAFTPAIGDGQGNDGTDQAQTLNITASGDWTVTSDPWLLVTPSSGTGNGTVSVALNRLEANLPETNNGITRPKTGTYSGGVTVTPASGSPVTVPVTYLCGYGDQIQEFI